MVTCLVQSTSEAYDHCRTARVARSECVRVVGKVLVKLPQPDAPVGADCFQHRGGRTRIEVGQSCGERGSDPDPASMPFLGSLPVPVLHWPGRRIVVRRAWGAGPASSPTTLLT